MFENLQDTCLLQNSLVSAIQRIESHEESEFKRLFDLEDKHGAAAAVSSTISTLVWVAQKLKHPDKVLRQQLHLQRRCHAVMLFAVLKSNDITCEEASSYYGSIAHTLPTSSWKFYVKLNFLCNWSECFIECSWDLQPDILAAILKKILGIDWADEEHMKHYSWHMVLQAIIWKFFIIEDSSLFESPDCCTFMFPFTDSNSELETVNGLFEVDSVSFARSKLLHVFVTLLNHLHSSSKSSLGSFDYLKVVLHAYKTIFKLLMKVKTCEKNTITELFRLNSFLEKCCFETLSKNTIEAALQRKDEKLPLSHCYVTESWDICCNYLVFILNKYWWEVEKVVTEDATVIFTSLEEHLPPCHFRMEIPHHTGDQMLFLESIIRYNYPCTTHAARNLCSPEMLEKNEILCVLEDQALLLNAEEIYLTLINAMGEVKSREAKIRLLKLFYQILSQSSWKIYNEVLKHVILHPYKKLNFLLDDFAERLHDFTYKTMSVDEAIKYLLPLFIQSPKIVLKTLIEHALTQGSDGISMLQVLKHVPVACLFEDALVTELADYFSNVELESRESKNMTSLVESLMEIHAEEAIINFDMFLEKCIVPNRFQNQRRLCFILENLNTALKVLVSKENFKMNADTFSVLVRWIGKILDVCISSGNGKMKELTISTLFYLTTYQERTDVLSEFLIQKHTEDIGRGNKRHMKNSVKVPHDESFVLKSVLQNDLSDYPTTHLVYTARLFGEMSYRDLTDAADDSSLITWCCYFKDISLFQEWILQREMSYEELVSILILILPHFTQEEWLESAHLISEYFCNSGPLVITSKIPSLLPKSDPELYAVSRCLMDCYYFILKKEIGDLHYITSCFTNTMMNILSGQALHPHLLLNIFLDMCHITANSTSDVLNNLLSFLLSIKQKMLLVACKNKDYLKLLHHGIKCLPDTDEKISVLQKFQ